MAHILIFIHWFVLVFTFGNVELVTIDNSKSNDFPIEELNGYTLREVFESLVINPNFTNTSGWTDSNSIVIFNQGIATVTVLANAQYGGILQNIDSVIGNTQYIKVRYYPKNTNHRIIHQQISPGVNTPSVVNQWIDYSFEAIAINDNNNEIRIVDNSTSGYEEFMVDYYYVVDKTALGISSLSIEQMNDWFNVYQENAQREISDTYEYIENELTTNDLIYIVLFALLWGLAIKIVKGVM